MGIEDLNADFSEHAERILVIAPNEERAQRIGKILEQRSCNWAFALDIVEASESSKQELFDMIICDWEEAQGSAMEAIEMIGAEPHLRRAPMLLIHPQCEEIPEDYLAALDLQVQLLQSPWEASALVVKVSAELRKRRLRLEEAKFYSKVSSQNVELRDLTNRFKRELKEAQDIQNSILPKMLPDAPGTLFAATYVPLEMVGGDLYDIWQLKEDLFGLFIGDVTGHGLSAAFIGAMTKMAMTYAKKETPNGMLEEMNAGVVELMPEGRFVTVAAVFYQPSTGELTIARGGHPPPIIFRRATKTCEEISPKGFPLGFFPEARYQLISTKLEPGDKLLLVTDGITEATNMAGKVLGGAGVAEFFAELGAEHSIDVCLVELLKKQEEFSEGRLIRDDITLVGIERLDVALA